MNLRHGFQVFRGHEVPRFRLIEHKTWWFALSGFFIALSITGLAWKGLNFSIDFTGGTQVSFPDKSGATSDMYLSTLRDFGIQDAVVEITSGTADCKPCVQIRSKESFTDLGARAGDLRRALAGDAGIAPSQIGNEQEVSSTWGSAITRKAIIGLIVFLLAVTIYISFRFEWKMAVSALTALLHDLIITAGIYALVGRQVTPETVIAILTILGYSLYDTVVIFDKVKENTETGVMVARDTYSGVVNTSLNQTLMRSVNTSLVVLLPIAALLLFGGETLKDFAFALFVGVASGTYSSIFLAAPMLALLKEREPRFQQIRLQAQRRETRAGLRAAPAAAAAVGSGRGDGATRGAGRTATATRSGGTDAGGGGGASTAARSPTGGAAASRPRTGTATKKKKGKSQSSKAKRRRR